MLGIAFLVIIQPNIPFVKTAVMYVEWVILGIVAFGLGVLAFKQKRLMLASMLSAGAICVYFDQLQSESPVVKPLTAAAHNQAPSEIKLGHYNLSNHNGHPDVMLEYIAAQQTDIITLLEYQPGWDSIIEANLYASYPFRVIRPDLGYVGMAILSRLPIAPLDSVVSGSSKMFAVKVDLENNAGALGCYLNILPLIPGANAESNQQSMLAQVQERINANALPSLVVGEFSDPNWNNNLRNFRTNASLYNSRVGMMVVSPCDQFPNFRVPSEHIFYSQVLECTEFQPIGNPYSDYIGLTGAYRFKGNQHAAQ